jgi:hypothetical protein
VPTATEVGVAGSTAWQGRAVSSGDLRVGGARHLAGTVRQLTASRKGLVNQRVRSPSVEGTGDCVRQLRQSRAVGARGPQGGLAVAVRGRACEVKLRPPGRSGRGGEFRRRPEGGGTRHRPRPNDLPRLFH